MSFWLLGLFLLSSVFTRTPQDVAVSAAGIVIAMAAAAFAITQRARPHVAVALYLLAGAGVVLAAGMSCSSTGYFGLCALAFMSVLSVGVRSGPVFAVAALVFLFTRLADGFNTGWLPWIGGLSVSTVGAAVLVHERRLRKELVEAQAGLAERTRMQERARIARDLHDVIAHSLTVSLLHISAARLAVQHDPDGAERALASAEALGRESLDEVRAIVGLTRAEDPPPGAPALGPTPGLESLDALVERYRAAGAEIVTEFAGDATRVPATVGTSAYRIVQEALTNAARHAAGYPVTLRMGAPNGSLEIDVFSAGPCPTGPASSGGGHGLTTMRERAEAVGGVLEAGPAPAGEPDGWSVRASLPLTPPRAMPGGRGR
jgi:signal transduction histidine kinase